MSEFSEALNGLINGIDFFEFEEWEKFLFSNPGEIQSWLDDTAIPRPHDLGMIIICLEESDPVPGQEEALAKFKDMSSKRATEVSPLGALMLPTVDEYIHRPAFNPLSSRLAKLWDTDKEASLLLKMYPAEGIRRCPDDESDLIDGVCPECGFIESSVKC